MPPSAAPEWLRVGWSFETTPTFAPLSKASIAARMPAQPAPITSTSWVSPIATDAIEPTRQSARSANRPGSDDRRAGDFRELLEVLVEQPGQLLRLRVVRTRIAPRRPWIEQARLHARDRKRHRKPEGLVGPVLDAGQLARERRLEQAACRSDRHPLTLAERPGRPASVDEPDRRAVRIELLAEHP